MREGEEGQRKRRRKRERLGGVVATEEVLVVGPQALHPLRAVKHLCEEDSEQNAHRSELQSG